MAFFTFNQNNSGGRFSYDEARGIAPYVIVEAGSADEANEKAADIGLYFDGRGDCRCCGDRWSETYGDGTAKPMIYDEDAFAYQGGWLGLKFYAQRDPRVGHLGFVHFADGRVVPMAVIPEARS